MIEIEMTAEQEWAFQMRKATPDSIEFRGYEYDLSDVYEDEDEARIEAMRRRDESNSTRKVLACVKKVRPIEIGRVVVNNIVFWAVYTRERSVE